MLAQACTHAWMAVPAHLFPDACANIKHGFAQREIFFFARCYTDLITAVPQWASATLKLRSITETECFRTFFFCCFLPLPSPLSLFLYLLMPEPISTRLCLRGCRQPKSVDVRLKISLQGIKKRRCCYDYYALLPVPAHEIMSAR